VLLDDFSFIGMRVGGPRRAENFGAQGLLKRACRTLGAEAPADLTDPLVNAKWRSKFPAPHAPVDHALLPQRRLPPIPGEIVHKCVSQLSNAASGGLSGWTKELLKPALSADPSIAADLGTLIAHICSEELGSEADKVVRSVSGFALRKDEGEKKKKDEGDVRPIAAGDAVQKLLGSTLFALDTPKTAIWQLGIGTPDGCAKILAATRGQLAGGASLFTWDGANAFNSISRAALAEAVARLNAPHLQQYFRFKYLTPFRVVARTAGGVEEVLVTEGVAQGDLPSGFYFCEGIVAPVEKALSVAAPGVFTRGYFDDLTFAGSTAQLLALAKALAEEMAKIGLQTNWAKSDLLVQTPPSDAEAAEIAALGVRLRLPSDAVKLLGSPVGIDESIEAQRTIVSTKLASYDLFFARVTAPKLGRRLGYTLLRSCGTPKFVYLCSVVPPEIMSPFYLEMDACIRTAFSTISGVMDPDVGFAPSGGALPSFVVNGPQLYADSFARVSGLPATVPPPPPIPDASSTPFASHCRSAVGNHAATWTLFTEHAQMSNDEFCCAMQLRCGAFRSIRPNCTCGFLFGADPWTNLAHALTCKDNVYSYTDRHDEIVQELNRVLLRWGFCTKYNSNEHLDARVDNKRPDLVVFTSRKSPVIDVTVVTNIAESHCRTYDPAAAAARAKTEKHATYVTASGDFEFFPVSCETSGSVDGSFDKLITSLSSCLSFGQAKEFRRSLCFALSVSLQRGNARILSQFYARLLRSVTFGTRAFF